MLNLLYKTEIFLGKYLKGVWGLRLHQMLSVAANYTIALYFRLFWKYFKVKGVKESRNQQKVIVSLTTFPSRINVVWICIETLMRQEYKPDRIILWLAKEQFESESKLPLQLIKLKDRGLEIRFCDDLKPHKKYYYTMLENPNDIIITFDDDILYPSFAIKNLVELNSKYSRSIVCNRGHIITFNDMKIAPYSLWKKTPDNEIPPNRLLCPTGVGGVLYPPGSLDNSVFDKTSIISNCLLADDLWLKVMSVRKGTKVAKTSGFPKNLFVIISSQKNSLSKTNVGENQNDLQLERILKNYNVEFRKTRNN